METPFTRAFALKAPIVQGPMGGVAGPRLVAAVAEAGGLGVLPIWYLTPAEATETIRATRALTRKPFAVNVRADLVQTDLISAAIDAGIGTIHLFWGDPAPSMAPIRRAKARMIATASDRDTAKAALDSGAAALFAQGVEAGGHVLATMPLAEVLPIVLEQARGTPVAAAGGIVDAGDVKRVLRAGAAAVLMGTRFAASEESDAHPVYKRALIDASGDTVRSECFDGMWPNAPHRTLKNSTFRAWDAAGRPPPGSRPGEGDIILRTGDIGFQRYAMVCPSAGDTGDCEAAALYAGTGVGRIKEIRPVHALIATIMADLKSESR